MMFRNLALALGVIALGSVTYAQSPQSVTSASPTTRLIPFSGVVADPGAARAGALTITFELYEEQNGGAPLWQETHRVQVDRQGRYLAYLGGVSPLPQQAFSEERARWLAVTIENRQQPRVLLVAVPYALRAADAETLGGQPASDFVRSRPDGRLETSAGLIAEAAVDGSGVPGQLAKFSGSATLSSSVISESSTNRIGVGLPDPTGGGVVDSVFTIKNLDNNTGFAVLNQSQARRFALNTLATGGWTLYDGGNSTWNQGLVQEAGKVTLGSVNASSSFENARLLVGNTAATDSGIFARKNASHTWYAAIHARSDAGVTGPVITAQAGVPNNTFYLNDAAIVGVNTNAGANGVYGRAVGGANAGIYGEGGTYAGYFSGNVTVTGTLTKGGGAFKIDHPLEPTTKTLSHSFVESPDMMNVYNGNVTLDAEGAAWVTLPEWFEALNRDFRYQLTALGAPAPNLYVASEVAANKFKIAGGAPNGKASWQITGVRQDAWANAHRIPVEEDKPENERGTYLHPDAFGQPVATGPPVVRPTAVPLTVGKQDDLKK